jgi:hypothetical protein
MQIIFDKMVEELYFSIKYSIHPKAKGRAMRSGTADHCGQRCPISPSFLLLVWMGGGGRFRFVHLGPLPVFYIDFSIDYFQKANKFVGTFLIN